MFRVVVRGDTNDLDVVDTSTTCRLEDTMAPADEMWPGSPAVTYRQFFTALGKAAQKQPGVRRHNWRNEYSRDSEDSDRTMKLFCKEFDFDLDNAGDEEVLKESLFEYLSDYVPSGVHTILSIIASPIEGEIVFLDR